MRSKQRFYRKFRLDVPREEVEKAVAENFDPQKYAFSRLQGPDTPPDVEDLVGKTLAFRGEEKNYDFVITAKNKTPERIHVKSVKLNGKPLKGLTLTHQQIMDGGTLEFNMK